MVKRVPSREKSKCKGPEVGLCLMCSENREEARELGERERRSEGLGKDFGVLL